MEQGSRFYQYLASVSVNIATIGIGSVFTWTSPILPTLSGEHWNETSPLSHELSSSEQSWVGSLVNIGAIFGPILSYGLVDRVGRKNVLLATAIPFLISWALIATTKTLAQLYVARIIAGFSVGAIFATLPAYVGEIAEKEIRGAMGTFLQLFLTFGFMLSFAVGPYVSFVTFAIISSIVPIIFFVMFVFMPETPYFYVGKNDLENASKSLEKLRGKTKTEVETELFEIKTYVESKKTKGKFTDLFTIRENRKAMFITMGLVAFQQLCCINAVLFYTGIIFEAAGGKLPGSINSIIIGAVQILSSSISPFFVDRMGRRILLQISGLGMGVGLFFLSLFFFLSNMGMDMEDIQFIPVLSLIFYVAMFCFGYGSLPWVVVAELFPSNIKSIASTVNASFCWTIGFIVTKFFPTLTDEIGMDYGFAIFAVFCVISAIFVTFALPETKGKSLQEIQEILAGSHVEKKTTDATKTQQKY